MKQFLKNIIITGLSVLIITLAFTATVKAQQKFIIDIDSLIQTLQIELDQVTRSSTEEYLEALIYLKELIEDYKDHLESQDDKFKENHRIDFTTLEERISNGIYAEDSDLLLEDISAVIREIKEIESEHKVTENESRPYCCRQVRDLRHELVILSDLIEDINDPSTFSTLREIGLSKHFASALKELQTEVGEHAQELAEHIKELKNIKTTPPESPYPPISKIKIKKIQLNGYIGQFEDSLKITSIKKPISIFNPSGGIQLTGWSNKYITASLGIEVTAASLKTEKEVIKNTKLILHEDNDRYLIKAKLPSITDPSIKINQIILFVKVPNNMKIETNSSFGNVEIAYLNNGLDVISQHSKVMIEDVGGQVSVSNKHGHIDLTDINGDMEIKSAHSPVLISDCYGDINVENEYNLINIEDCQGNIILNNSGKTEVNHHSGNIQITNTYGLVDVEGIDGNVIISNAYQPIMVSDVSGETSLANLYALVNAENISGPLTINNNGGEIVAVEFGSTFELESVNNRIVCTLSNDFSGMSSITASYGDVDLILVGDRDLTIKGNIAKGNISSHLPIKIIEKNGVESFSYKINSGKGTLVLNCTNTELTIIQK